MHTAEEAKAPSRAETGAKVLKAFDHLESLMEEAIDDDEGILSLRVAGPEYEGGDLMVIVRRVGPDGQKEVAFYGGFSLSTLLMGLSTKLRRGDLKWRKDKYA